MTRLDLCLSWFFLFLSVFLFFTVSSVAGELQLTPSIRVREEYIDNLRFSVNLKEDAFISTISPGLEFRRKTVLTDAYLSARVDGVYYDKELDTVFSFWKNADDDELDTVDHFYSTGVSYRFSPRLSSKIDLKYNQDSRVDRDVTETGLIVSSTLREQQRYSLSGNYLFSEKTSIALSYSYNRDRYEELGLAGFKAHSTGLGLTSDLSRFFANLVGQGNLGYYRYNYPGFHIENSSFTLGTSWNYSETLKLVFNAGPRYARSKYDTPQLLFGLPTGRTVVEMTDDWGLTGKFSLSYQGLYSNWNFALSQEIAPASGRNGATERTKASFNIGRRISEDFRLSLNASYFLNKTDEREFATQEIDDHTWRVNPICTYRFNKNIRLKVSYSYTKIEERNNDLQREKNAVFFDLHYDFPLLD